MGIMAPCMPCAACRCRSCWPTSLAWRALCSLPMPWRTYTTAACSTRSKVSGALLGLQLAAICMGSSAFPAFGLDALDASCWHVCTRAASALCKVNLPKPARCSRHAAAGAHALRCLSGHLHGESLLGFGRLLCLHAAPPASAPALAHQHGELPFEGAACLRKARPSAALSRLCAFRFGAPTPSRLQMVAPYEVEAFAELWLLIIYQILLAVPYIELFRTPDSCARTWRHIPVSPAHRMHAQ